MLPRDVQAKPGDSLWVSGDLKLDWSASFLLYNHRSRSDRRPNHKCADLVLYEITTSKFAIQRQVEESSISHPTFTIEEDAYRPYLFNLRARLAPTCLPAFQAGLPAAAGSYCEIPATFLVWPKRPEEQRLGNARCWVAHQRQLTGAGDYRPRLGRSRG